MLDERLRHGRPVGARDGDDVRPVGAGGAVELAQVLGALDAAQLSAQAVREDGELLAHRRRRGRLPVRAAEHRDVGVLARHVGELVGQRGRGGQPHVAHAALHHERVRQVVDVLGRAREVHELARRGEARRAESLGGGGDAALDEVLDGLDVVHRLALDGGELGDLVGAERGGDPAQVRDLGVGEGGGAGDDGAGGRRRAVAQRDQPLDLDVDARPVQRGLAEVVHQRCDGAPVAAVERAEREGRRDVGEVHAGGLDVGRRGLRRGVGHGPQSPTPSAPPSEAPTAVSRAGGSSRGPCPAGRGRA